MSYIPQASKSYSF